MSYYNYDTGSNHQLSQANNYYWGSTTLRGMQTTTNIWLVGKLVRGDKYKT